MKNRRVIFRADGGASLGMGHVVRSLALADMLKDDFSIAFALQQTDKSVIDKISESTNDIIVLPQTNNFSEDASSFYSHIKPLDIIVLDGYNFKTDYQKTIKASNAKLVAIDDLHEWHHVADAIINHADEIQQSDYSAEPYTKFFLGLNYILLRKEFLTTSLTPKKVNTISKVFISMGAADINNLSLKFTQALLNVKGITEIHLMLGSINLNLQSIQDLIKKNKQVKIITHFNINAKELKKLLQSCDVAICPASTISFECCATGIGLISGYTAENQLGILKTLIKYNSTVDFNNLNQLSVDDIRINFEKLFQDTEIFNEQIKNQSKMIDARSSERLLDVFKELVTEKLNFRMADASDTDLYFKWTNDPLVRSNSFNTEQVSYQDHVSWFKTKLNSDDCKFYLFSNDLGNTVGQVRIDKIENEIVIGISIDENFRGKSLGVEMLKTACDDYIEKNPGSVITAYIKTDNIASYNIFLKAGFANEEVVSEKGNQSYKLYRNKFSSDE